MATTWLRAGRVPFALAGLLALPRVRTPDVLVSEDGETGRRATGDGRLAVNRDRAKRLHASTTGNAPLAAEQRQPSRASKMPTSIAGR